MQKQTSYNSVKSENNSANKTLFRQKFRYLHLHKTPVFVLLSAAALKACGGGGGSSGGGTQDGSVFFKLNEFSLASVVPLEDNSFTISENSQPVLRDDRSGGKSYYYLLGSVLEGTKIVNPDTPENNIYFDLDSRELYLIHSQIIDFEAHSSHVYGITLEKSGISSALRFSPSDVPQDEEYEIHSVVGLDTSDALSYVYEVDEVIEGGSNDVIASFSIDTASVVLSLEGADKDDFDFNNRELIFKNAPDYEIASDANNDNIYELTLVSTQDGAIVQQQNFEVHVLNIPEGDDIPPLFTVTNSQISREVDGLKLNIQLNEGSYTGIVLLETLSATDPDTPQDDVTLSLKDGTTPDGLSFDVSATDASMGTINVSSGANFDYENTPDLSSNKKGYSFTILATESDDDDTFSELTVNIEIVDVDEAPVRNDEGDYQVSGSLSLANASSELVFDVSELISRFDDPEDDAINTIIFDTNSPDYDKFSISYSADGGEQNYDAVPASGLLDLSGGYSDGKIKIIVKQGASPTAGTKSFSYSVRDSVSSSFSPETSFYFEVTEVTNSNDNPPYFSVDLREGIGNTDSSYEDEANILTIKLNENQFYGMDSKLATITATDNDGSDGITYTDNIDTSLFAFADNTGLLTFAVGRSFSYEDTSLTVLEGGGKGYSFTLVASENDADKTSAELKVNIEIVDEDGTPTILPPSASQVFAYPEGTDVGASIYLLTAIDDIGDVISWSIVSGNDDDLFTINSDTGALSFKKSPVFKDLTGVTLDSNERIYELEIQVSSTGSSGVEKTGALKLTITINDVDYAPVIATPTNTSFTYDENVEDLSIATLTASDENEDTITWSIKYNTYDGLFVINSDTGDLSFVTSPDFDVLTGGTLNGGERTYALVIQASSTGFSENRQTVEQRLSIIITNVDEAPVITTPDPDTFTFMENIAAGTSIVDLDASDPDDGDDISWSIKDDAYADLFTINSDGVLSFVGPVVFEALSGGTLNDAAKTRTYVLTIEASSHPVDLPTVIKTHTLELTITINDVDEAPVIATPDLDAFTYDENIIDLSIATFTATDENEDTITWSIVSGNDDSLFDINNLFTIDSSTGVLSFKESPNFEASSGTLNDAEDARTYALVIQASSTGFTVVEQTATQRFSITITDVNEAPMRNSRDNYQISENLNLADTSELIVNVSDLLLRFRDPENNINKIVFDTTSPGSTDYDKFSIYYSAYGSNYNLVTDGVVTLSNYLDFSDDTIKIVSKQGEDTPTTGFKSFSYSVRDAGNLPSIGGSADLKFGVENKFPQWSYGSGNIILGDKFSSDTADDVTLVLKGTAENPLDFSDLSFSRQESGTTSPLDSTSITITIPESSTGAADGGVITIGYSLGDEMNADRLRFDKDGDGNTDIELSLLPQRSFTAWNGNSDTPTVTGTGSAELIVGSSLRDRIDGGSGDDYIYSLGGNDRLEGGDGNDHLYGGDGEDIIYGGDGKDIIYGGRGAGAGASGSLYGGAGNDSYIHLSGDGTQYIIEDGNNGVDKLILKGISRSNVKSFNEVGINKDLKLLFKDTSFIILRKSYNQDHENYLGVEQIHFDPDSNGTPDESWYDTDPNDPAYDILTSFTDAFAFDFT